MNYTEFYYGPEGIMDDRRDRGNGCDECRDENWQNMNEYDGMSERNDLHREAADFSNSRRSVMDNRRSDLSLNDNRRPDFGDDCRPSHDWRPPNDCGGNPGGCRPEPDCGCRPPHDYCCPAGIVGPTGATGPKRCV